MKRDEVKALFPDATDEQIDKLMAINGADINKAKGDLDTVKAQLKTAQTELSGLKAQNDQDALTAAQQKAEELQAKLDAIEKDASVRALRAKVSKETKVPAELLTGETEEDCKAQAEQILAFAKPSYPSLPDGGEAGGTGGTTTAQLFAEWSKNLI